MQKNIHDTNERLAMAAKDFIAPNETFEGKVIKMTTNICNVCIKFNFFICENYLIKRNVF